MINTKYKIIRQNIKTALQHELWNQRRYLSWPVPQGKFNVFIYLFFQVVSICFFKFADEMTQKLFKLTQKYQQGAKVKQINFFSNDNRVLDFYCLKVGKTQQQWGWMGIFGFTVL